MTLERDEPRGPQGAAARLGVGERRPAQL